MAIVDRIFAFTVMGLIALFALIHLGVSVGIIVPYRKYGDILRPQIGLSAFNLVVCIFGLVTGILGIVAVSLRSEQFARIVCLVSGILGIFALGSLVAAIIINDRSINYVSSHITSNLNAYPNDANAKTRIDMIQNKYQCCGSDSWLDWKRIGLNSTSSMTTVLSTTTNALTNTVTVANNSATTMITPAVTMTSSAIIGKRDVNHVVNGQQASKLTASSRKKRQITYTYGDIEGLPITFGVILPPSCCAPDANLTSNTSNAYCVSNYNGVPNHFNTVGCARSINTVASDITLGFAVINSFMTVLAFITIPTLLGSPAGTV